MQAELVQQSADLAFLFDGYHTVSELQDCLKLCQSHERADSQTQVRKDKEVITLLQAELATHEKRITSLKDNLDITCQENKVYQDELDKQQLLLDAFQSQLDRTNSKIMAVNLQAMSINSKSHHNPLRSSSPEFYHSYKSDDDHTWLAPNCHGRFHHAGHYLPKQEGSKSQKTFVKINQVNRFKSNGQSKMGYGCSSLSAETSSSFQIDIDKLA
ncbi:hypothetical protein DSO57_1016940 [Entomophthora muscae]|uniref:Uncharacterized protein n=1 Tax=Entomophthora muscae TaxID=34485 RepID=A0ACC2TFH3_9FUNG|nr:hypothetical protein DSO57_1016940 [Entomophthora muscae]